MEPKDRRALLLTSASYSGIDFIEIANDAQTELRVHFLNGVALSGTLTATPTITGGETIPTVAVQAIDNATDWLMDGNDLVLSLKVQAPGDFSNYTLTIQSPKLDPFFSQAAFSFKARCNSTLDCKAPPPFCPREQGDAPPIDYLAKDFLSFRQALLDFSALSYPAWQERSEADFGMVFLEALAALGDDLSYTQDRVAAEAALNTATQRRSVVRLARLVDYEAQPATSATVQLQFNVSAGVSQLPDGLMVTATGPDGSLVPFETGSSLNNRLIDPATGGRRAAVPTTTTSAAWNTGVIQPYWLDDSQRCLPVGATQMYVLGRGFGFQAGQPLLIETAGATNADPPICQIVHLVAANQAQEIHEPFFPPAPNPPITISPPFLTWPASSGQTTGDTAITLITWEADDALLVNRDLTRTTLVGNIIPATQGQTVKAAAALPPVQVTSETFAIPPLPANPPNLSPAIVRTGPNDTAATPSLQYLYTLTQTPVAWLQPVDASTPQAPEILLEQRGQVGAAGEWTFFPRMLEAGEFQAAFTLEAARYSQVGRSSDGTAAYYDYDGDDGDTIRFGDGEFGNIPPAGAIFDITYRVTAGSGGNVAAGSITLVDPAAAATGVTAATNPLPAAGGADAEPLEQILRFAPEEFRAVQYRAVRPEDYQAAAQTLPWVMRANTAFRWTGSWRTTFTSVDPVASEQISISQQTELINLLNRYRMAGSQSYVPPAQYVSVDLAITVCAQSTAFNADVEKAVLAALNPRGTVGAPGFFNHANFTFGQSLERASLEAAIQDAPGVAGVLCVLFRVRNRAAGFTEMPDIVTVASEEIIRCDNDPSIPEAGSINLTIEGGR
jgi:hypothetical protein